MTVENLTITVKTNADEAAAKINTLSQALNGIQSSAKSVKVGRVTKEVENAGKAAQKAVSPLSNFAASLKRIAFYRFIRSILKSITEAIQEGLNNVYEYSRAVGGELAPALDRIASASAKMKNQLGAAFGQLLQMLEPIIVFLINIVTKLAQAISWLFAVLSGSDTYLVANDITKSWKDTEDATKGATRAAKEYENQLLGFDVINRLNAPNSGSGGKSKDDTDYAGMFHEESVGFRLPDITNLFAGLLPVIGNIRTAFQELVTDLALVMEKAFETAGSIQAAWEQIVLHVKEKSTQAASWVESAWQYILEVSAVSAQAEIDEMMKSGDQAQQNITKFINETLPAWRKWAENVGQMAAKGFENVAIGVYEGLQSAADNIVSFVNAAAEAIHSWAQNAIDNVVSWANGIAASVSTALSSAWENFKGFMQATGQAISAWWNGNKAWVIPATITAAVVVGSIALAPVTGGASLGAIALAAEGGAFPNNGSLFIAGEAGAEVVANMGGRTGVMNIDQMREAVRQGVYDAMIASGGNDQVTKLYLDGREIGEATRRYERNVNRATGVALG